MERRTRKGYKLRVYMDAIKQAKATTDEAWIDGWASQVTQEDIFISRLSWIAYLEACVLNEVNNFLKKEAA